MIGELSLNESKTLDSIIHAGLGVGISCQPSSTPSASTGGASELLRVEQELTTKPNPKLGTSKTLDSIDHQKLISEGKKAIIKLNRVKVTELDVVQVSEQILNAMPIC